MTEEGTQPLHGPSWWRDNGRPRAHRQDAPFFYGYEEKQYRREMALHRLRGVDPRPQQGPYAGTMPHGQRQRYKRAANWTGNDYDSRKRLRSQIRYEESEAAKLKAKYPRIPIVFTDEYRESIIESDQREGRIHARYQRVRSDNVLGLLGLRKAPRWQIFAPGTQTPRLRRREQ